MALQTQAIVIAIIFKIV